MTGKKSLTFAKPLNCENVLKTVYSFCVQLKRHGTVFLCMVPKLDDNFHHLSKRCHLGPLLRSPTIASTIKILSEMTAAGYVTIEYEVETMSLYERVIVVAHPKIQQLYENLVSEHSACMPK